MRLVIFQKRSWKKPGTANTTLNIIKKKSLKITQK